MHMLNTDTMPVQCPTQVIAVLFGGHRHDDTNQREVTATITVEINDQKRTCVVMAPSFYTNGVFERDLFNEWNELTSVSDVVPRTVTLIAEPSTDIVGTAHFAIKQIDLRVEEGESRFFADVIK